MNRRAVLFGLVLLASRSFAGAELVSRPVEYKDGDTVLEGFLAYDTAGAKSKPGVLVVHEWTGLGDYVKKRSEQLAKLGYVAFAADIYGKGVRPSDPKEAGKTAGIYKGDRALMRSRVNAGLSALKRQEGVDAARTAAIGYCFGGTAVLELARSGAEVQGVVSFHGGLASPSLEDARRSKPRCWPCTGRRTPMSRPRRSRLSRRRCARGKWIGSW